MKNYKREDNFSYCIGVFPCVELWKHKRDLVEKIYLHSKASEEIKARFPGAEINDVLVEKISDKENVYAVGVFRKYKDQLSQETNHLVLVQPEDRGNLGTILRASLGLGVAEIGIISPGVDVFDPRVIRASMGAFFQTKIQYFSDWESYRKSFPGQSCYPFMIQGEKEIREVTFNQPWSFIFGSESSGLPAEYKNVGQSVRIAQSDRIDSLNLATSVAIALFYVQRI